MNNDEFLWTEKYRPSTINECILPEEQRSIFNEFVKQGEIPNMLLCGSPGVGKTTIAKALASQLEADFMFINASLESGIDVLRTKIQSFASTVSFSGGIKIVLLDEADYTNPTSFQPALRAFIEEFSSNCRFIFTCNFKNRIIPPLHSRCTVIEFKISKEENLKIKAKFHKRVMQILEIENTAADPKVVARVIDKHFPDYRRVLNELQRYSVSGKIDEGILVDLSDENMNTLKKTLKDKDWKKMRAWVVNNLDNDPASMFRKIYDTLLPEVVEVPHMVLLLADYQYKAAFVVDHEINLVACLTDIMSTVNFK